MKKEYEVIGDWEVINTSALDIHNDYIQLYKLPTTEGFLLSDAGFTLEDLYVGGYRVEDEQELGRMIEKYEVFIDGGALETHSTLAEGHDLQAAANRLLAAIRTCWESSCQ